MKYLSIILILFASCTSRVKVRVILDGDTIITEQGEHIRLAEIDASELHQQGGQEAKQFLSSLIAGRLIEIKRQGKDKYNRTLALLACNGLNINLQMVSNGEAWSYRKKGKYYNEQLKAMKRDIGLWRYSGNIPPYLWRLNHKH